MTPYEADEVRDVERRRLAALVAADFEAALPLHADDFQLMTPLGRCLTRDEYFDAIRTRVIHYLAWEPGPIGVRLRGEVALIRYRAQLQFPPIDDPRTAMACWHIDSYERRGGRWQVVWSHATRISTEPSPPQPSP